MYMVTRDDIDGYQWFSGYQLFSSCLSVVNYMVSSGYRWLIIGLSVVNYMVIGGYQW